MSDQKPGMQLNGVLRDVRLSLRKDDRHVQVKVELSEDDAMLLFQLVQQGGGARIGRRVWLGLVEKDE